MLSEPELNQNEFALGTAKADIPYYLDWRDVVLS